MNVSVRQVEVLGRRIVEPLPLVELGVGSVRDADQRWRRSPRAGCGRVSSGRRSRRDLGGRGRPVEVWRGVMVALRVAGGGASPEWLTRLKRWLSLHPITMALLDSKDRP
jgi:hypothetical protein